MLAPAPAATADRVVAVQMRSRFDGLGLVHAALPAFSTDKLEDHFDANGAALRVQLPKDQFAGLKSRLRDATGNRVHLSMTETA